MRGARFSKKEAPGRGKGLKMGARSEWKRERKVRKRQPKGDQEKHVFRKDKKKGIHKVATAGGRPL